MDFPQTPLVSIVAATASGPNGVLCNVQLNIFQSGNVIGSVKSIVNICSYNYPQKYYISQNIHNICMLCLFYCWSSIKETPCQGFRHDFGTWLGPFECAVAFFCSPRAFFFFLHRCEFLSYTRYWMICFENSEEWLFYRPRIG